MPRQRETDGAAVLLLVPVADDLRERLAAEWPLVESHAPGTERDALLGREGARIGAIVGYTQVDALLLAACPNARLVATFAAGYENVDLDAARRLGVAVVHAPGVSAGEVADTTVMLLLAALKRLPALDRLVRSGAWPRLGQPPPVSGLSGLPVGVAGTGPVGRAILSRLTAFGIEPHCHARHAPAGLDARYHASLLSLAGACDALIIALPGGPETRNAVDAEVLGALGPAGIVVNVGRGSVVDEEALCTALETGALGFAALDVFATEPHVPARLRALENVILTPHYAGASLQARAAKGAHLIETLRAHFAGRRPSDRVC
ncbi:NAD(P)-dependent oxidoreductase [Roseitranquillus sediminis]|uniref:NAD(P)-dependent oxidoreductase n=1 Tax=Roseitranquillus sediminis TaxID=2809051 RepID=UPI001D0C3CCF|nr:NAD(P)-dependent oxidoreductase [Roseitranquillus sediminis]MBM9593488.1 2-hydroxyacid dehydrogenase [Roseitranquillus sediminis]